MSENQKQYLFDIIGALLAGGLITNALIHLIPEGMWLHLISLVFGTAIIVNKLNGVLRGN